jgi:hypothetical protein
MQRLHQRPQSKGKVNNQDVLVVVHCYSGDKKQVQELMPVLEHHGLPIVIASPVDYPVTEMGPHICITAGERAYIGQKSWDRQHLQLKALLQFPQKWFLLNDSDSFCLSPKLPDYLFEDEDVVWNNEVEDFRKPGVPWGPYNPIPHDYHAGYPIIAMQPPYFMSRKALEKIVAASEGLQACPITPFIDWWYIPATYKAGLKHKKFLNCVSCESKTGGGQRWMRHCIRHGAEFIHSVKTGRIMKDMLSAKPR